jgi:CRP-like cAMP-binding protein
MTQDISIPGIAIAPGLPDQVLAEDRAAASAADKGNRLLQSLDAESWALIEPQLERTALAAGEVLEEEGQRSPFVYFPIEGAVSIESGSGPHRIQLTLIGREGFVGPSPLLGGVASGRAVVQFPGSAWRVGARELDACLERRPALRRRLLLAVNALIGRLSFAALANGRATIDQRVAGWLLAAADCLDTPSLPVTHAALSEALGVRRSGVTLALQALQGAGAIRTYRGGVSILDRRRLQFMAFEPQRSPRRQPWTSPQAL